MAGRASLSTAESLLSTRNSSTFSSARRDSSSLPRAWVSYGSMKRVSPEFDMSCTTPLTCPLESLFTGTTHLPFLSVT